MTIKKQITSDF